MYIYLIKIVLDQFDPRFESIWQQKYDGILKKGVVMPFDKSKVPRNANIIRNDLS